MLTALRANTTANVAAYDICLVEMEEHAKRNLKTAAPQNYKANDKRSP